MTSPNDAFADIVRRQPHTYERPRVLIFRNDVLPMSETFVATQAAALNRYQPVLCGLRSSTGGSLATAGTPLLLTSTNNTFAKYQRASYLALGFAPGWKRRISRIRPKLIHAHFAVDAACALPLVSRLRVPMIVTLHGYDVTKEPRSIKKGLAGRVYLQRRRALFQAVHTFICVSTFIRDQAIRAGFPTEKLVVHPIGIDLDLFSRKAYRGDCNNPLILFTGRLVEKKGCADLLKAAKLVQQQLPSARLTVVGDGPLGPQLRILAAELGLRNCRFLGSQSATKVRHLLQEAHVFCVPSVTASNGDSEGLGMVFLEAQALGVPVVSTWHGGIPEAVSPNNTALLVPEHSPTALADALLQIMQDHALWSRMSHEGPIHVAAKYDLHRQTRLLEDLYDQAGDSAW